MFSELMFSEQVSVRTHCIYVLHIFYFFTDNLHLKMFFTIGNLTLTSKECPAMATKQSSKYYILNTPEI